MDSREPRASLNIAFVTGSYPSPRSPSEGAFVQQFVWAMARQGNTCTVIRPTSVFDRRHGRLPPEFETEDAGAGHLVNVRRPGYLSFSCRDLGWTHTGRWTQRTFNSAVYSSVCALPRKPHLLYGHFLYQAGQAVVAAGARLEIPSISAVGEGTFWTVEPFGFRRAGCDFRGASGFIAVATHIKEGLIADLGVPPSKIIVEPNGVDLTMFHPGDRALARETLGLDPTKFLIAFVGAFDDLKGGAELVQAVEDLDSVGVLLLGQGPVPLVSRKIVFKGQVAHDAIPIWLKAADIFALPTKEEGSCNAVIEAISCGLPLVTSNGRYMDDIVDDEVAIRIDPNSVHELREAILALKKDPVRRERMSKACCKKAMRFDINDRARRVTTWMETVIRSRPSFAPTELKVRE